MGDYGYKPGYVWDEELRRYRRRKTGWKNPGATNKPRDAQGRFLPDLTSFLRDLQHTSRRH